MRAHEVAGWIERAREKECVRIVVRRAQKNGPTQGLFDELPLDGLDVDALVARMRDDVLEAKRKSSGVFELTAWGKATGKTVAVLCERLTISRDDEPPEAETKEEDPIQTALRVMGERERETGRKLLEMADKLIAGTESLIKQNDRLATIIDKSNEREAHVVDMVFQVAQLKEEQAAAIRASEERRAMAAKVIEELGPIAGSVLSKMGKTSGPAIASFFNSLKPDQVDAIRSILKPEQVATLGTIVSLVDAEKRGDAHV